MDDMILGEIRDPIDDRSINNMKYQQNYRKCIYHLNTHWKGDKHMEIFYPWINNKLSDHKDLLN